TASAPVLSAYFRPPVARPPATGTCAPTGQAGTGLSDEVMAGSAYPVRPGHGPRTAGSRTPDDRDGGAARGVPAAGRLEPDDIAAEPRHVDLEAGLPQGPLGVADGAPDDVRDRDVRLAAVVAADLDRARVDEAVALVDDDRDPVP